MSNHFEHWTSPMPKRDIPEPFASPWERAEAARRHQLKKSGLIGWLRVKLTKPRKPKGGHLPPGLHLIHNTTSRPEHVYSAAQMRALENNGIDTSGFTRITREDLEDDE